MSNKMVECSIEKQQDTDNGHNEVITVYRYLMVHRNVVFSIIISLNI